MVVKNITLTLGKMSMDEIKGKQTAPADEMVQTLDGRIVNKKEIKNGEIYINAQGKKVRKVIKKVVKSNSGTEGSISDSKVSDAQISSKNENLVNSSQNSTSNSSVLPEPKKVGSVLPEPKKVGENNNVLPEPKNTTGEDSSLLKTEDEPELSQKINTTDDSDFRERLSSKHSFLQRMRTGGSVSAPPTSALPSRNSKQTNGGNKGGSNSKGGKKGQEEEVALDKSVSELEEAVLNENYQESIGKNGQTATGQGRNSSVSGKASNPRGNILNNPLSNADNDIARGLAGSYSLAQPKSSTQLPLAKSKKQKTKKPISLWVPASIIAAVYIIICGIYFISNYNFSEKTVSVGEYFLNAGANSKTEYYDGERFNFFELAMTYDYGEKNIQNIDMSKLNLTTRANEQSTMGYTLNNGYISARWEGEYATATKREVNVEFRYGNEIGYIPITIYRNRLESLSGQGSVVVNGDKLSVLVWGNYTNDLVKNHKADPLPQRKLAIGEYELFIVPVSGGQFKLTASNVDASSSNGNVDTYKLTASQLRQIESGIDRIEVRSTESSSIRSIIFRTFHTEVVLGGAGNTEEEIGSEFQYGFKCVDYQTDEDINGGSIALNDSLKFKIELKEGYYKSEKDFKVEFAIKSNGGSDYGRYKTITSENIFEVDGNTYFRVQREDIDGDIKVKISGVTNIYPVYFLVLNSQGKYEIDETKTINVQYKEIKSQTVPNPSDYLGHTFEGWKEATNLESNPDNVSYVEGAESEKFDTTTSQFSVTSGTAKYYYAQYALSTYKVSFRGNGFKLSGNITHKDNRVTPNVEINTAGSYTFTEGDKFIFTISPATGFDGLEVRKCEIFNGVWFDIQPDSRTRQYTIEFSENNKITEVFVSTIYKITTNSPFIEKISDENNNLLTSTNGILTDKEKESYTIKVKLKNNGNNLGFNGDKEHPVFEKLTYSENIDGYYVYTVSPSDIQNLELTPTNVYAKYNVQLTATEGSVTIKNGENAFNGEVRLTDISNNLTLTLAINEDFQIQDGGLLVVTINDAPVVVTGSGTPESPYTFVLTNTTLQDLLFTSSVQDGATITITVSGVVGAYEEGD